MPPLQLLRTSRAPVDLLWGEERFSSHDRYGRRRKSRERTIESKPQLGNGGDVKSALAVEFFLYTLNFQYLRQNLDYLNEFQ